MNINGPLPDHFLEKIDKKDRPKGKAGMTVREALEKAEIEGERALQNQIEAYLRLRGIIANRNAMHKKTTCIVGWPDFTFAINGKACALEVKWKLGSLSPQQRTVISEMKVSPNNWTVEVVRSVEDVKALLERMGLK